MTYSRDSTLLAGSFFALSLEHRISISFQFIFKSTQSHVGFAELRDIDRRNCDLIDDPPQSTRWLNCASYA